MTSKNNNRSIELTTQQKAFLNDQVAKIGTTQVAVRLGGTSAGMTACMLRRGTIARCKVNALLKWMLQPAMFDAPPQPPIPSIPLPKVAPAATSAQMADAVWAKMSEKDKTEVILTYLSKTL